MHIDSEGVSTLKRGNLILHYFTDWKHKEKQKKNNETSQMVQGSCSLTLKALYLDSSWSSYVPLKAKTAKLLSLSESTIPTVLTLLPAHVSATAIVKIFEYSINSEC